MEKDFLVKWYRPVTVLKLADLSGNSKLTKVYVFGICIFKEVFKRFDYEEPPQN